VEIIEATGDSRRIADAARSVGAVIPSARPRRSQVDRLIPARGAIGIERGGIARYREESPFAGIRAVRMQDTLNFAVTRFPRGVC